jgi:bifunctional non-homologous end joining protein LigD
MKKSLTKNYGKKAEMPVSVSPMLCTLTREVIQDPEYLYEFKWDGYRIIGYVQKGKVLLESRGKQNYTSLYPTVAEAMVQLGHDMVLDGEMVVFNDQGKPDFNALQNSRNRSRDLHYCVFDIIWKDGYDLQGLPLTERKEILQKMITGNKVLRFSESFDDGLLLYKEVQKAGLEGIVAKRRNSMYQPGQRKSDWLKIPTQKRQEFVIGGWAESDKSRAFRSLLFGAYKKGKLEWIGRSGGGYKDREMPGILKKLQDIETGQSPFINKVLDTKGATIHWVKPQLVANFAFADWTTSGRIRKPATFLGFREDKKAIDVVREIPKEAPPPELTTATRKPSRAAAVKKRPAMRGSNWPRLEKIPVENSERFDIASCDIELTDVDREIWKGVAKANLIQYYHKVAGAMLPFLKNRPQSLYVKPVNAGAPGFYIKDMEGREPPCAELFTDSRRHPREGKRSQIDYLVCNNESTLLWMVNLGCIDINPWSSRILNTTQPDFILIDLDPTLGDDQTDYHDKLLDTALATKEFCDRHKLKAFVKTSGQTGIHFYIPCIGIDFPGARRIAEFICAAVHKMTAESSTCAGSINSRGDKVYIDPSQNDYADTLAAPYSVRPFHIPTVSTPLEWKEINRKLDPQAFTIDTVPGRLRKKGDLFSDILNRKIARANSKKLLSFT